MDLDAFDPRLEPANLGQPWDRLRRQQDALTHADVALRLLARIPAEPGGRAVGPKAHRPALRFWPS
jgi:hypothetical protein